MKDRKVEGYAITRSGIYIQLEAIIFVYILMPRVRQNRVAGPITKCNHMFLISWSRLYISHSTRWSSSIVQAVRLRQGKYAGRVDCIENLDAVSESI
jgi:hypothetical protein